MSSSPTPPEPAWMDAENGYSLALVDGKLACRNSKGKQLKSVPAKVKKGAVAEGLLSLRDWLSEHEGQCREFVERLMLRSLPLRRELLLELWADPAWRAPLLDAVVGARTDDDVLDAARAGFLRSVDPDKGVGVVDLDGESLWIDADELLVPHPILLEELEDFRELATDLQIQQGIPQLFRETHAKADAEKTSIENRVSDYANGHFEQLNFATGKCKRLGYRVRGGFASCTIWEAGQVAEARYWIGAEYPEAETWTGDLFWADARERPLKLNEVGPVAYSEGRRMAAAIYAARKADESEATEA